jgi:hypothetical protein
MCKELNGYVQNLLSNIINDVFALCKSARRQPNIDSANNVTFKSLKQKI